MATALVGVVGSSRPVPPQPDTAHIARTSDKARFIPHE